MSKSGSQTECVATCCADNDREMLVIPKCSFLEMEKIEHFVTK